METAIWVMWGVFCWFCGAGMTVLGLILLAHVRRDPAEKTASPNSREPVAESISAVLRNLKTKTEPHIIN